MPSRVIDMLLEDHQYLLFKPNNVEQLKMRRGGENEYIHTPTHIYEYIYDFTCAVDNIYIDV